MWPWEDFFYKMYFKETFWTTVSWTPFRSRFKVRRSLPPGLFCHFKPFTAFYDGSFSSWSTDRQTNGREGIRVLGGFFSINGISLKTKTVFEFIHYKKFSRHWYPSLATWLAMGTATGSATGSIRIKVLL